MFKPSEFQLGKQAISLILFIYLFFFIFIFFCHFSRKETTSLTSLDKEILVIAQSALYLPSFTTFSHHLDILKYFENKKITCHPSF